MNLLEREITLSLPVSMSCFGPNEGIAS